MDYTPNYDLNQWSRDDRIRMEDFNADNAKIDGALARKGNCRILTGQYTGTGQSSSDISGTLTFSQKPLLVVIHCNSIFMLAFYGCDHALVLRGNNSPNKAIPTTWEGNTLSWYMSPDLFNQLVEHGMDCRYIAFLEA